jgi:hypothetical protein
MGFARCAAAVSLTTVLVATGCSDDNGKGDPAGSDSTHQSASMGASQPPEGMQWVVDEVGLRFAAPEPWAVIDGSSVDDRGNAAAIEWFAAATNDSLADLRERLRGDDQLLVAPREQSSIYVTGLDGGRLPSEAAVRRTLSRSGSKVEVETVLTTLGDAIRAQTVGRVDGTSVYGESLYVGVDGGVGVVLILTEVYEQIAYLESIVLPSLSDVG